jgi:hypothetical protein
VHLTTDLRRLPGSLPGWDRLISALSETTDDTVETSYLELKGPLNLFTAEDRFAIAKAILAFANRDPAAAAPFFGGRALIVIGVSKGDIAGVRRIEDHDLRAALKPYVGEDDHSPRWVVERYRVDDQNDVLIIVVDAPLPGDPIFTLRRDFERHLAGKVFARPSTASVQADPSGIQMLSGRLLASRDEFEVVFTLGAEDIGRYTWDPKVLEPFLEAERRRYLRQLPKKESAETHSVISPTARAVAEAIGLSTAAMAERTRPLMDRFETRHEEDRSEEEFRAEADHWLEAVRGAFPEVVRDLIAFIRPPAAPTLRNFGARFLEDLEVEVHIEGPVIQHERPFDERSIMDRLPYRPRQWGPWIEKRPDYSSFVPVNPLRTYSRPAQPNTTSFRNSGSVTATLRCKELRPFRSHTFGDHDDHTDVVLLATDLDLSAVHITATATARGIDSRCVTEFTHPVAAPIDVTEQIRDFLTGLRGRYFMADE